VGTRIAVIADPEDDLSTLEIPPEESPKKEAPEKSSSPPSPPKESSPPPAEKPAASSSKAEKKPSGQGMPQKYPLYPSVAMLVHTHHIKAEDITPTGPNGRLLKGDVLAYLDEIPASYPKEVSSRVEKLAHLDLSNIKPAPPKTAKKADTAAAVEEKELPVSIAVPVSLSAVLQVQKRMQDSLGITLPLSTFIARAIALANEDLPLGKTTPTQNDLFNSILGLDKLNKRIVDGHYSPSIVALPPLASGSNTVFGPKKNIDVFDDIIGGGAKKSVPVSRRIGAKNVAGADNVFSLSVDKGEAKRAKVFLERVKSVLEVEPGRLVL
jgi:hypothetical protein